jgi:hypothetical protein
MPYYFSNNEVCKKERAVIKIMQNNIKIKCSDKYWLEYSNGFQHYTQFDSIIGFEQFNSILKSSEIICCYLKRKMSFDFVDISVSMFLDIVVGINPRDVSEHSEPVYYCEVECSTISSANTNLLPQKISEVLNGLSLINEYTCKTAISEPFIGNNKIWGFENEIQFNQFIDNVRSFFFELDKNDPFD